MVEFSAFPDEPTELKPEKLETIYHNGMAYIFDLDSAIPAVATYLDTIKDSPSSWDVWWQFELTGAHDGPPIVVEIKNPRLERDDDGTMLEIEHWRWSDDKTPFDDDLLTDCYCDAVRDAAKEILCDQ